MKKLLPLLLVVTCISFSCENHKIIPFAFLEGKWVNVSTKTDTLIFENVSGRVLLYLRRDKEMQNGFLAPKAGAGMYEFKIEDEKITVYYSLSSCYCFHDYFFKQDGTKITIGNFYEPSIKGNEEVFEKLN